MLAKTISASVIGIEAFEIEIEVNVPDNGEYEDAINFEDNDNLTN